MKVNPDIHLSSKKIATIFAAQICILPYAHKVDVNDSEVESQKHKTFLEISFIQSARLR